MTRLKITYAPSSSQTLLFENNSNNLPGKRLPKQNDTSDVVEITEHSPLLNPKLYNPRPVQYSSTDHPFGSGMRRSSTLKKSSIKSPDPILQKALALPQSYLHILIHPNLIPCTQRMSKNLWTGWTWNSSRLKHFTKKGRRLDRKIPHSPGPAL